LNYCTSYFSEITNSIKFWYKNSFCNLRHIFMKTEHTPCAARMKLTQVLHLILSGDSFGFWRYHPELKWNLKIHRYNSNRQGNPWYCKKVLSLLNYWTKTLICLTAQRRNFGHNWKINYKICGKKRSLPQHLTRNTEKNYKILPQ